MKKSLFLIVFALFIFWVFSIFGNGGSYGKNMVPRAQAATTGNVLLTGTILEYIALTFSSGSTISFGNVTPGTPKCGDFNTQADVVTNAANGYTLGLSDGSDTNSAMVHTDAATYIPDMSGGGAVIPLSAPVVWVTGTHIGVGVTMFAGTQKEAKWGTGTTVCDLAYDKYGAVPSATTPHHTVTGFHAASDASNWDWRIDVQNTQKTGQYDGNVLFTSTAVLS